MSDEGTRWFEQPPTPVSPADPRDVPKDLWVRCPGCQQILFKASLVDNLSLCPGCGHHHRPEGLARLLAVVDPGSFVRHDQDVLPTDALGFFDSKPYASRLKSTQRSTGEPDAYIAGSATIYEVPVEIGTFNFRFMGGSMGSVVGELITRQVERAVEKKCPVIIFSASGGARMQEGLLSLMQMARTSAALANLRDVARQPYISVLTDPTTGGVAASFAMLGDVILAEPKALIGFAGPRVIQQTIGQELPEGFQTSEYLLEHGMIDRIVPRQELRDTLGKLLKLLWISPTPMPMTESTHG